MGVKHFGLVVALAALVLIGFIFLGHLVPNSAGYFSANNFDVQVSTGQIVKIGFIGPISGTAADGGLPALYGMMLANEKYPDINGVHIELIAEDDKYDAKEALTAAKKLVEVDDVPILVTVGSASTLAILPYSDEKGFLLTTSVSASPKLSETGKYFFRLSSSSKIMAQKAAQAAYFAGFKKVVILYEQTDYTLGWKDSFKEGLMSAGGEVLGEEAFALGATDVKIQLEKLSAFDADAIVVVAVSSNSATNLLREIKEQGITKQIIGSEIFSYSNIVNDLSRTAEGILISTYDYDLTKSKTKQFSEEYKKRFDYSSGAEVYAALGYDEYLALREAIGVCHTNATCIKTFVLNRGAVDGIAGEYSINSKGDAERSLIFSIVANGTLIPIQ